MRLSASDYDLLQQVLTALLTPLESSSLDQWASRFTPSLKVLLAADSVIVSLPSGLELSSYSKEFGADVLARFGRQVQPLAQRFSAVERAATLGVYTRATLWHTHLTEYYRSEYYHGYVVPNRFFDLVGLATRIFRREDLSGLAMVLCHHLSPVGPRFGVRDVRLLRLILPAFNTGVWTFLRFSQKRSVLNQTLDLLSDGLLLCDNDARVLHANSALLRLMSREPEGDRLLSAMRELARELVKRMHTGIGVEPGHSILPVWEISTAAAAYRLRGTYVGSEPFSAEAAVMIAVERTTPELPSEESLREQYGLSRKEARVALCLAQGNSNETIATRLCISPHTARHHTERVLMKLGALSRAEVGARVLSPIMLCQGVGRADRRTKPRNQDAGSASVTAGTSVVATRDATS